MPLYEYICQKCQHPFEALVRGKEKPRCPQCGGGKLKKQISGFSAVEAEGRLRMVNPVLNEGGGD